MDKIQKVLNKLTGKEKKQIKMILGQLKSNQLTGLDITKLKSKRNIFRVRKGKIRIIYSIKQDKISILAIERRSESTYKF